MTTCKDTIKARWATTSTFLSALCAAFMASMLALAWTPMAIALACAAIVTVTGCDDDPPEPEGATWGGQRVGGVALTIDFVGDTDVVGVEYRFERVSCDDPLAAGEVVAVVQKELEDQSLPAMIPGFEDQPLDRGSAHLFSDHFQVLDAGCYTITAQPITGDGSPSADCAPARAVGVEVVDGLTREVLLISQCRGSERGALDTVTVLNHPPELEAVVYQPSKFAFECQVVTICVTARDPDGDPVEFEWSQSAGPDLFAAPRVVSRAASPGGALTECVEVVPTLTGDYGLTVAVFDLLHDGGALIRTEAWLALYDRGGLSRDVLTMPLYVNWTVELACYDADTGALRPYEGVEPVERAPGCAWITPEAFYCDGTKNPEVAINCPGGVFAPETVYLPCR